MITEIRAKFAISDDEALYIKEVTDEKTTDKEIQDTVVRIGRMESISKAPTACAQRPDSEAYDERGLYDELSDLKYLDTGGIFDIMAVTVIDITCRPM